MFFVTYLADVGGKVVFKHDGWLWWLGSLFRIENIAHGTDFVDGGEVGGLKLFGGMVFGDVDLGNDFNCLKEIVERDY